MIQKITQKEKLKLAILNYCNIKQSLFFTLKDINFYFKDYEIVFEKKLKNPESSVRFYLQRLRDDGFITFIDNKGTYKLNNINLIFKNR